MGLKEAFSALFRKGEEEKNVEEKISRLGIDVVNDRKLEGRIALVNALHDEIDTPINTREPLERLETMRKRLQSATRTLKIAGVPYGRAADVDNYRTAMFGWESLVAITSDIVNTVESTIRQTDTSQEKALAISTIDMDDLERKLENFLGIEVFPYAFYIMDASYSEKDVSSSYTAVIQQVAAIPRGIGPESPPEPNKEKA
jgi:hypothetical protein